MKKNIEILKDENSILTSYKIDLEQKKRMLQNELRYIKKQKSKNLEVDETKVKDLIMEKIHKPNISIILEKELVFSSNSIPLVEKGRIITRFRRYDPKIWNAINVDEEFNKNEIQDNMLIFDYNPNYVKCDESNNKVNHINEQSNENMVILPHIEKINIIDKNNDDNNVAEKTENNVENTLEDHTNNELVSNNQQEDNATYPVPYKKLQKYKWWAKKHNKDEYSFDDVENHNQKNNEVMFDTNNTKDDDSLEYKKLFDSSEVNFNDIVEWVKFNNKKNRKKRKKEAKKNQKKIN